LAQNGIDFYGKIYPQIKEAVANTLKAFWQRIRTQFRDSAFSLNQFEIFGYDFMIDTDLRVYLIEVNTNPCLSTSPCGLLQRLIPQVLDQTFKLCVDPFLQLSDPARMEQMYTRQSSEMSISELEYEMVYSNAEVVIN